MPKIMNPPLIPQSKPSIIPMLFAALAVLLPLTSMAQVTIDPPTRTFTKDGGGGSILTSGTGTWTASTAASWLTITPRTTGAAGVSCIYVVNSNLSADTRQGTILIGGLTHTVTQTGYTATLSPTSASKDLNGGAGAISVTTSAGVSWTAVSNADWITLTPASGTSNGSVAYTAAAYSGVVSRTGSLTIAGKTFTVTQTGADVNLAPKSIDKAYSSDIVQIQVTALGTTVWSVTSQNPWISVVDGGNGFGDSNVTLAISTNPSFAARTGTVSIGTASFTINQEGTPNPVLDLLPREATADPIGAYGNVAVLATPDAPWTAQSMDSWLALSSGATGAGNGNIQYVASANPSLSPRTGRIQVTPPVYVPAVDLTKQLWTYIPGEGGADDVSGWVRNLSGAINTFDGTFSKILCGAAFSRENDHSMSFAIQFKLNTIDTINRLLQIKRSASDYTVVYVNAQNKLVLQIGAQIFTTSYSVVARSWQQLVITATNDHQVLLYAGTVGSEQISLIGSYSPGIAPFPADYLTTPSQIIFGYSALPSTGYLANGGMKELRIYGRTLSAGEVSALHLTSINGLPFGTAPSDGSPAAAMKMNLRGQALASLGDGTILQSIGLTRSTTLPLSMGSALTTSEKLVSTVSTGGGLISSITGGVFVNSSSGNVIGVISWRYQFAYMDGTSAFTSYRSVSTTNSSGYGSFTDTNPNPTYPVATVSLLAQRNGNVSSYSSTSFSGMKIYSDRELSNLYRTSDRFGITQRALVNSGAGSLILRNHGEYFSNGSSTYNFWLRMDSMPSNIFTRGDLILSIDASRNVILSGPVTATLPSPIQIGKWHMITLAGCYSPARATVYVDGNEIGNVPGLTYGYGNIGANYDMTIGFIGAMDEVSFYNGVLTPTQIQAIYQRESPQAVYHAVTQGVVDLAVSPQLIQIPAGGGSSSAQLTVAQNVNWTVSTANTWISVTSPAQGAGSATVAYDVAANPTVYQRQGTISVAGKTVTVVQLGLNATVQHGELVFSTDGGSGWIEVSPEGNGQWQAASDVSWLTVALGATGAGQGSVFIVADPYTNISSSRTGSVTVAGQKVYITQRGYELSISPQVAQIGSNAGAGEFGVAAPISAVWEAIVTQPWITIQGSTNGIGNGTMRYSIAANDSGAVRTGRIIVAGKEYTITQVTKLLLATATTGAGTVSGAGSYDTNAIAVLTATPTAGNVFSHWTGDAVGSTNPLNLSIDSGKTVTANFITSQAAAAIAAGLGLVPQAQLAVERAAGVQDVIANPNPHGLFTTNQMHGLALGRPVLAINPSTGKMNIQLGLKNSTNLTNWADLGVVLGDVGVVNGKLNVQITPQGNAAFYRIETNGD